MLKKDPGEGKMTKPPPCIHRLPYVGAAIRRPPVRDYFCGNGRFVSRPYKGLVPVGALTDDRWSPLHSHKRLSCM